MTTQAAYFLVMLVAVGTGFVLNRREQARLPLDPLQKLGIALGALCGGVLGAKLPFVLGDAPGLVSGRAWLMDGKTITFGLVGGYFGVELAKWACDVRVKTGDAFAVPVAVAIGLGRLGCFTAGCCHGLPTTMPWGVVFHDGVPRHPTQLYEAAFHLTAAVCLLVLKREGLFRGQLIKLYFVTYFAFRFSTEFLRPEPRMWGGLTGYQWTSLALIPLFALLWWHDARRASTTSSAVDGSADARPSSGDR